MESTNLNSVKITGTLGRQPEHKAAVEGRHDALTTISIAHNRYVKLESGKIEKVATNWFRCVAWGALAQELRDNTSKGDTIQVFGRLESRSFTDKDTGKVVTTVEITMTRFEVVRRKAEVIETEAEAQNAEEGGPEQAQS